MNLVDSCGWLEYFADSPYADVYAPAIEDTGTLIVPTICILEVCKRVLVQRGEDAALQVAAVMHQGQVVPLWLLGCVGRRARPASLVRLEVQRSSAWPARRSAPCELFTSSTA